MIKRSSGLTIDEAVPGTKGRVRVAYILTPITFGGSEKVSLNFLRGVDKNKYEVHPLVLTRPWEGETFFAGEARKHGYRCKAVPVAKRTTGDPLRVVRVLERIYRFVKGASFDLVHTNGYFADICALPVAKGLGIKCISTCHGFISNDRNLRLYNILDRLALRLSDTVLAVSEGIKDVLVSSGVRGPRIKIVENSVGNSYEERHLHDRKSKVRHDLSIGNAEFVIGFVGRLSEEKGVAFLINAAAQLASDCKVFKVILVGDGPAKGQLEHLVKKGGLEKNVLFTGFQTNVEDWLSALDVFVLPSLTEGTPMALLEAMSMGVPVIASAVGGVPSIVKDGINGFLVEPGDVSGINEKIRILKANGPLRESMAQAGVETIRARYDVGRWCRRIEEEYDLLLNRKASG